MRHTIALAQYNFSGYVAVIENEPDMESVTLAQLGSANETCMAAATKLRAMADRFEALANEERPCHEDTHKRINKLKRR